jgi:hypothetical protein
MKVTRVALRIALLTLLTLISYWAGERAFVWVYAQVPAAVRPYVMEEIDFQVSDGKEIPIERTQEARRRDGAIEMAGTQLEGGLRPGAPPAVRDVVFHRVDLPDGSTTMFVDAVRAKSSARFPADVRAARNEYLKDQPPQCAGPGEKVDGQETLFGHPAFRIILQASQNSLSRVVGWSLPEFNCKAVQALMQSRATPSGPWETTSGSRLVAFTEADPDPGLFVIPSDYTEMKPSDIKRALSAKDGRTPQECPKCFADDPSDINYMKWR